MKTTRYIAKCRKCNCVTSGLTAGWDARKSKSDPSRGGTVYTSATGSIVLDCRVCGEARRAEMVRGRFSAKHLCNDKCLSSTGTVCNCSCGGQNHGGAFGVAS